MLTLATRTLARGFAAAVPALGLIAVLVGASGKKMECRPKQRTEFTAGSCVNSWPAQGARFRWPDLQMRDQSKFLPPAPLDTNDCKHPLVQHVFADEHLARIFCKSYYGDEPAQYLVNLDSLACHDDHPAPTQPPGISAEGGERIVARAEARMHEVEASIRRDAIILVRLAKRQGSQDFYRKATRALERITYLEEQIRERLRYDSECEPLSGRDPESGTGIRAQRSCRTLVSARKQGERILDRAKHGIALRELTPRQAVHLGARTFLFYVLRDDYSDLPGRLERIRLADESGTAFWELNNGFVYGGSRLKAGSGNGYDCSDFVRSMLLDVDDITIPFSTAMLRDSERSLAGELRAEDLPKQTRALASCFVFVDVRGGEALQPGDLIVSSTWHLQSSHVVLVKKALPNHVVVTIEAAGGYINAIKSKTRPLLEPEAQCGEATSERARVRPDLHFLRLRDRLPASCPLAR